VRALGVALLLAAGCSGAAGPGEVDMAVTVVDGGATEQVSPATESFCAQWMLGGESFSTKPATPCHGATSESCSGDAGAGICFRIADDAGPYSRVTFSCAELATTDVPFCCCY